VIPPIPKVELHSHLDCCLSFGAARRIDPSITADQYERRFVAPQRCGSLDDFLAHTMSYRSVLQTRDALQVAVQDVFEQMRRDDVVYAELRFAPFVHTAEGLSADAVVGVVADEVASCSAGTGIAANVILCTLRDYDGDRSLATAVLAERHARRGAPVVALDIAGPESRHPLDPHVPAFRHVREAGLGVTAHAGEGGGPESVLEAVEKLGATRIGHGVRSVERPDVVEGLRVGGVHLEICVTSNVQTNTVPSIAAHPLNTLRAAGVSLSLSTDARAVSNTDLHREYELVQRAFGWDVDDFVEANRHAITASFASDATKVALLARLRDGVPE
jgi:adenosine deaminase